MQRLFGANIAKNLQIQKYNTNNIQKNNKKYTRVK